jgi:hypothetical protein
MLDGNFRETAPSSGADKQLDSAANLDRLGGVYGARRRPDTDWLGEAAAAGRDVSGMPDRRHG